MNAKQRRTFRRRVARLVKAGAPVRRWAPWRWLSRPDGYQHGWIAAPVELRPGRVLVEEEGGAFWWWPLSVIEVAS